MNPYIVDESFWTRKRLYAFLLDAPESRSFGDVSVSSICKAAAVSRATFYRHFDNVEAYFSRFLDDVIADATSGIPMAMSPFQAITMQCAIVLEDESLRRIVRAPGLRALLERVACARMRQRLDATIDEHGPESNAEQLRFLASAVSDSLPPMLLKNAGQAQPVTPDSFAAHAVSVLPEPLMALVGDVFL